VHSVRTISLNLRLWMAAVAAPALSIGTWSVEPAPANAGVVIGVGIPFPVLYAHTRITPIRRPPTIRIIRRRHQLTRRLLAIHLNRAIRLKRAGQAVTLPGN